MIALAILMGPDRVLPSPIPPLSSMPDLSPQNANLSLPDPSSDALRHLIPSISQLRDLGWMCSPDRFKDFRQLIPIKGYFCSIDWHGYPVCTDGVHVVAYNPNTKQWLEGVIMNWEGKLEAKLPTPTKHIAMREESKRKSASSVKSFNPPVSAAKRNKQMIADVDDLC